MGSGAKRAGILGGLAHHQTEARAIAHSSGPWDFIDAPAQYLSPGLSASGRMVARSVQPELEYLRINARRRAWGGWLQPIHRVREALVVRGIRRGWQIADRILCLGSAEREEMSRNHAALASKLGTYLIAPGPEDRRALRVIAAGRRCERRAPQEARFLWIGRWSEHKGTGRLVGFARDFLRTHAGAGLTIAGSGSDVSREFPGEFFSRGQITVVPSFVRSELPSLLERHDAGLFTSEAEGWGLSVQEMLESGLPVFATRVGAVCDLEQWFPEQLRPFPPSPVEPLPGQDASGISKYLERFDWHRLAEDYLAAALSPGEAA